MQEQTVLAYLRVSKEEQARGASLDAQRAAILGEAERRGWADVRFVVDPGRTSKNLNRPGFMEAREILRRGDAVGLVVSMQDRLTRNLRDFVVLMAEAQHEGWWLLALDCPLDPTTPNGEAMVAMRAVFAQWERRVIGQRIKEALAVKKAQGVRIGRPRAIPDVVMDRIARERADGRTLQSIADGLNNDGIPTAHGGARWHPSTVSYAAKAAA